MNVNELIEELRQSGIRQESVLEAIRKVPREKFVTEGCADQAYENKALPIAEQQTISQPYIVGLMTQALDLDGDEKILEVGTGSGYQAAILSRLCNEVITIERIDELRESAESVISSLNYTNISFHSGDGTLGHRAEAPYDGILVTAATPSVPKSLLSQLKENGRLVIPVGTQQSQELQLWIRNENEFEVKNLCACRFVPLIGEEGWSLPG